MEKLRIVVLFGGNSPEHEVSLQSASAVIQNLDSDRYQIIPIGITKDGRWFRYYGTTEKVENGSWAFDRVNCIPCVLSPDSKTHGILEFFSHGAESTEIDAVFPVLHGENGEDGSVQGLVELSGIPLIGCGTLASALAMDKRRANEIVLQAGIPSPQFKSISQHDSAEAIREAANTIGYPLFVKPNGAGSSFGISKVSSESQLFEAVDLAMRYDNEVLLEEAVDGFEIGCAVMGTQHPLTGEIDEIELQKGFFDFDEKYNLTSSTIHLPARIDDATKKRAKETAIKAYSALGCQVFARVDLFFTKSGEILFNEINTIPGFTSHSRFPNMMKGAGFSYSEILDALIGIGMGHEEDVFSTKTR